MVSWHQWQPYDSLPNIEKQHEACGVVRYRNGLLGVVRPTLDGNFAVLQVDGRRARVVKVLPSEQRARAYNLACS